MAATWSAALSTKTTVSPARSEGGPERAPDGAGTPDQDRIAARCAPSLTTRAFQGGARLGDADLPDRQHVGVGPLVEPPKLPSPSRSRTASGAMTRICGRSPPSASDARSGWTTPGRGASRESSPSRRRGWRRGRWPAPWRWSSGAFHQLWNLTAMPGRSAMPFARECSGRRWLPPWPLTMRTRRKPCRARLSRMSRSTAQYRSRRLQADRCPDRPGNRA